VAGGVGRAGGARGAAALLSVFTLHESPSGTRTLSAGEI